MRLLVLSLLLLAGCGGSDNGSPAPGQVHFVPNSHAFWSNQKNWTTTFGPAYADITLAPTNFVPCRGGPYALCYYSGPSGPPQDLGCTLTKDGKYANCLCYDIPYGVYFVDINAILNHSVYEATIAQCGMDGSGCQTINSAPVCQQVNQGTLIPGSEVYSTFSLECIPTNGIGQTDCGKAPYAGCMTAPCSTTDQTGIVKCSCPVYDGPYQVGQNDQACTLGGDLVWSAAYAPPPSPTPTAQPTLDSVLGALETAKTSQGVPGPAPGHACRMLRVVRVALCISRVQRCFPRVATSIARRFATSTTAASSREARRQAIPATRRSVPMSATIATWSASHARDFRLRDHGNHQGRNRRQLQLLREPVVRMQSEPGNRHGDNLAQPAAARPRHYASMRHQWHAVRNADWSGNCPLILNLTSAQQSWPAHSASAIVGSRTRSRSARVRREKAMNPGDVDLSNPDLYVSEVPHEVFTWLRREDPVHWNPVAGGRGFWSHH